MDGPEWHDRHAGSQVAIYYVFRFEGVATGNNGVPSSRTFWMSGASSLKVVSSFTLAP